jgi:CheY-like chemotaxis protein
MLKFSSILLVDDDSRINDLNERLLRQLGVADRYIAASDSVEALAALQDLAAGAHH